MAEVPRQVDAIEEIRKLRRDLNKLAARVAGLNPIKQYSDATRPGPATMKGAVIYNTTHDVHEGSDGTAWYTLY